MTAGGASFIPSSWVLLLCLGVSVSDDGLGYLTQWSETGPDSPSVGNGAEIPVFGNETDVLPLGNGTDSSPLVLLSNGTVFNKSSPGKISYIPFRNSRRPKEDDESSYKKMNASYIRENLFTKKVPSEKRAIIPSRYHNPIPPKPATLNIYKELLDSPPIPSPATVEYEEEDDYAPPFVPTKNEAVLSESYGPNFPPWMHIGNSEDYRENVRAALAGFFHRFPQRDFEESVLVESEKNNHTSKQKVVLIVASPEDQLSEEPTLPEPIYHPDRWANRNRYRGVPPELIPHLFSEQIPIPKQPLPYPFSHTFNPRSNQGLRASTGSEHLEVEEEHEEEGHGESHEEDDEGEHEEHEENYEHGSEHQKVYQEVREEEEHDHEDEENENEEDQDDDRPRNHVRTVFYGSSMPSFIPSSIPFPLREGHSPENSRGLSAYHVPYMLRMWDEVPQTTEEITTIRHPSATTEEEEEYDDAEEDVGDLTAVDSGGDVNATTETKNSSTSTVSASASSTTASPIVADASSVTSSSPQNAIADGNQTLQKRLKRERQLISDDGKTFTPFDEKNPSSVRDQHLTVFPENHKVVKHVIPDQQLLSQSAELHSADYKSFLDAQFSDGDGSAFSNVPRSRKVRTKREPTKPCTTRQKREDAALPTSAFDCNTEDSNVQRLKRIREVKDRLDQERAAQEAASQKASHNAQVKQDQELLRQIFDGEMEGEEDEEEEKAESLQFDADDDDGEEKEQFQDDDDGENTDQEFQDDDDGTKNQADKQFQDDDDGAQAQKFDDDDDSTAEQKRNQEDNVQLQEGDDGDGAMQTISEDEDRADVVMDNGGELLDDEGYQNDQEQFQDDGDSNYAFNKNGGQQTSQNLTVVNNSSSISGGSPTTTTTSSTTTTTSIPTKKPVWEQEQLMVDDSDDGNTLTDDDDVGETLMDIESSEQFQDDDDDDGEQQFQDDDDGAQFQDDDDGQQSQQFQDDDDGEAMADDDDDGEEEATEQQNDLVEKEARLYDQPADPKDAEKKEVRSLWITRNEFRMAR
ncbi:hypothetical protein RvY_18442-2 [Ramazzottius varieornatus]|uniref:Uncharacterized protein n=1 Tax=Ramazzottius varieornatus TaxID=947166 RepID=A0A1D1W5S2_RAMVA|nr:hypothetical protein RvY_18442-2 [Ramazzottius varieornatus]